MSGHLPPRPLVLYADAYDGRVPPNVEVLWALDFVPRHTWDHNRPNASKPVRNEKHLARTGQHAAVARWMKFSASRAEVQAETRVKFKAHPVATPSGEKE